MNIDAHWLKDKYKNWTDDELHACYRDIAIFGGSEFEMAEVSTESERRALAKIQREDEKAAYRQEDFNEEEYEQTPINIPVEEVEEEDK